MIIKDKILTEDIRHWDGIERSASRRDSQGGTIIGKRHGNYVDILTVYGQSLGMTDETLSAAISSVGSRVVTFTFTPGAWEINTNVTVPSNIVCRVPSGVVFNVSSGVTLTFSGPVIQDHGTWTSGSGTVTVNGARSITAISVTGDSTVTGDLTITGDLASDNFPVSATTSSEGLVELATSAEAITGTDTARAVTPDALSAAMGAYHSPAAAPTAQSIAAFAESTWTTIGPTGSGMSNIWSALDAVPTDVDWIRVRMDLIAAIASGTPDDPESVSVYARPQGASWSAIGAHRIAAVGFIVNGSGLGLGYDCPEVTINVTSLAFEIYWAGTDTAGFSTANLYLLGYGYNGG